MFDVLIVDDEPQTREYLTAIIPRVSPVWNVVGSACNGAEALAAFGARRADLVITDIRMPEMDGMQLCERLLQQEPSVMVAFISGYDEFVYAKEAIRLGVSEYLLKPITRKDLEVFLQKVERHLTQRRRQNEQLRMLRQLSDDYQKELIRNFCHACLDNVYIRIQTLQPLLYRMHAQQLEKFWCVVSAVSEAEPSDGYDQWAQNRYLLLQMIRNLLEEKLACGYVLEANDGSLLLCVCGENEEETDLLADRAILEAERICDENFHARLSSCKSAAVIDILQLHEARKEADTLFPLTALYGAGRYTVAQTDERVERLRKQCAELVVAWRREDATTLPALLTLYCEQVPREGHRAAVRFLLHQAHKLFCPHLQTLEKQLLLACADDEDLSRRMIEVFREHMFERGERTQSQKLVDDAVLIIRSNLSQPISLGYIADHLNVSANYLSRIFHATTGESYIRFLTHERMELAARLLRASPDARVYDVAEQTGYYNVQHFCHVFRNFWGMTPTQYQRPEKN